MRKVLLDVINAFPACDFRSDDRITEAIKEIGIKLGEAANFKERQRYRGWNVSRVIFTIAAYRTRYNWAMQI